MSTNQSAVTLCGWELKAGVAHYGRPVELYFHPVVSFNLYLLFYSSPNLSSRTLDVYHTSTHDVALVRI